MSKNKSVDLIEEIAIEELIGDTELEKDTSNGSEATSEDADMDSDSEEKKPEDMQTNESADDGTVKNAEDAGPEKADEPAAVGDAKTVKAPSVEDANKTVADAAKAVMKQAPLPEESDSVTDSNGEVVAEEEDDNEEDDGDDEVNLDFSDDIKALDNADANLTEGFKAKAAIIFEAAVKSKLREHSVKLKEKYQARLDEATENVRASLAEKVDSYLTYVSEKWITDNALAIDTGIRAEIAESFIASLKGVFVEHYIDVPASKTDIVEELANKAQSLEESLAEAKKEKAKLNESLQKFQRESILVEAAKGLAATQAERLQELAKDVTFESEEAFVKKVNTIKESYFRSSGPRTEAPKTSNSTENLVENIDQSDAVTPAMKRYTEALSRVSK
jgi:hypothetical protein